MCPCEIGCDGSEARDSNDWIIYSFATTLFHLFYLSLMRTGQLKSEINLWLPPFKREVSECTNQARVLVTSLPRGLHW
jgi:hypothetical protein